MSDVLTTLRRAVNRGLAPGRDAQAAHAFLDDLQLAEAARDSMTHSPECWRWHLDCAVARVRRLETLLDAIADDLCAADWAHWRERIEAELGASRG